MNCVYLADTSAVVRILTNPELREAWRKPLEEGIVAICDITELEILYSARSLADRLAKEELLRDLFAWIPTPDGVFPRAHHVQRVLTEHAEHRSAGPVDLVVAAAAELSGLTLVHYDRDFETVAGRSGLRTRWLAEPGST